MLTIDETLDDIERSKYLLSRVNRNQITAVNPINRNYNIGLNEFACRDKTK
jgi:hypothetical protein